MSANSGPTKGESTTTTSSKTKPAYDHLDINKLYKGKSTEPAPKQVTQRHGMQALGKAIPARRPPGNVGSSLKGDPTLNDISNSSTSIPQTTSSTALVPPGQQQQHQTQGNASSAGWASSLPQGPPSPHTVSNVPITGQQQHINDKNWSGASYPSQKFAQDFPSLESGGEGSVTTTQSVGGSTSNVQGPQSMSKPQDNQYGPGPILRPQTIESWTQGGGRGARPPLNAPREFQGPEGANLGGPTPPPMGCLEPGLGGKLGQAGPVPPPPLGAYQMPFRGMLGRPSPPPPYMYPNGPPGPGPGVFYQPGMPRYAMTIPPRAPPPGPDGPRDRRGPPPPSQQQRPGSHFISKPILKEEDLKRMDEIGVQDGGWASTRDDVDYYKTINFSDEDEGRDGSSSKKSNANVNRSSNDRKDDNRDSRDREQQQRVDRVVDEVRIERDRRPPPRTVDRQPSISERDLRERDNRDRENRDHRFENVISKESDRPSYNYNENNEEDWKQQQQQPPPPPLQSLSQQQQPRRPIPYDGGKDNRMDPRDRRDDRSVRRRVDDDWRSNNNRFDDDIRGNKGPQSGGRQDSRMEPRDFPTKNHPSNLPPRLQRQQMQAGPAAQQQQQPPPAQPPQQQQKQPTPPPPQQQQPLPTPPQQQQTSPPQQQKQATPPPPQQQQQSLPTPPQQQQTPPPPKLKMSSWADEVDDDEIQEDLNRKAKQQKPLQRSAPQPNRIDYIPKVEERQKRVYIDKNQRKVADMQPPPQRNSGSGGNRGGNSSQYYENSKRSDSEKDYHERDEVVSERESKEDNKSEVKDERKEPTRKEQQQEPPQRSAPQPTRIDYIPKVEERQKRVYIDKNQRKVADMQPPPQRNSGSGGNRGGNSSQYYENSSSKRSDSEKDYHERDEVTPVRESKDDNKAEVKDERKEQVRKEQQEPTQRSAPQSARTDYVPKGDERQKRVYINKNQRKVSDMQPPQRNSGSGGNRGGNSSQYYENSKRSDSEKDYHERDEVVPERESSKEDNKSEVKDERKEQKSENSPNSNFNKKNDGNFSDEREASHRDRPKKEKNVDNSSKKVGKNSSANKRNNARSDRGGNNKTSVGGGGLVGYGPPSDQKPFSNAGNKEEEHISNKEKGNIDVGQPPAKETSNAIPSLMAVDISPPNMSHSKNKGHRDRDRDYGVGRSVPPRMQNQRGGGGESYSSSYRGPKRGKERDGGSSGVKGKIEGGEDSEDWTDNESDESKTSSSIGNKSKKEVKQQQQPPQQQPQQQREKDFGNNSKPAARTTTGEKVVGKKRVKNPPYEPRSSHNNLPPRFAAKQRDSQSGPATKSSESSSSKGSRGGIASSSDDLRETSTIPVNAWEKPPAFRPDQNSQNASQPIQSAQLDTNSKDSNDLKTSSVPISGGSPSSTVLDGTNPPARSIIFENRNLKSGGFADTTQLQSKTTTTNSSSKLPEVKKDSVPTSGIEFGKNLGSLGFGKGEDSPELDFGSNPFDDPSAVSQSQVPTSIMTTHTTSKPPSLLHSSRHSFDHQPSPISPCAAELTEKIQSVKRVWETPMPSVPEQPTLCGNEENAFHGGFGGDSFKSSNDSGSRDFGSSLPQSAVGYSSGSSPSLSAISKPESSSSPNSNNIRPQQSNKPQQQQQQQQQPPVTKSQGHGGGTITSAFAANYNVDPQQFGGNANAFGGGIPVVAAQPAKMMYKSTVLPLDAFGTQFQYPNAPPAGCGPYGQGGNGGTGTGWRGNHALVGEVLVRPSLETKYQPSMSYQQHQTQNRASGQGANNNRMSPGPVTSTGSGIGGGHRQNMVPKNSQPNRNTTPHTCMTQQPVHPGAQPNYYHTHPPNAMSQQQHHKGSFGPASYSEGGMTSAYQPQILIPVDVPAAMFNLSGNYESSEIRSGPGWDDKIPPPGTPPVQVQGQSSYYFGSNNNPACVFPTNSSQNYGLPFTASLKMSGFNSTGGSGSDGSGSIGSNRIRPEHSFMQPGLDMTKSGHVGDYMMSQQRWNSGDFQVNQGVCGWPGPGPIQRPIYNNPSAGPVGMPMVHSSSHYIPPNIGTAPIGCVGVKPNNSSNDSMNNPGTPPKSPHPRKL